MLPVEDPRLTDPSFTGQLETIEEYGSASVIRILAPNPSPMTLDGTNTYLLWDGGSGACVVVDPGPNSDAHWSTIIQSAAQRDLTLRGILLTHHHQDHCESAFSKARELGLEVFAHPDAFPGASYVPLRQHGTVLAGGVSVEVIPTPGHCGDHLAFLIGEGYLLTGDHVLGRGTSVVAFPDGDLTQYLGALEKISHIEFSALLPGHGPSMDKDMGHAVLAYYHAHRRQRLTQIMELLSAKREIEPSTLVVAIYGNALSPEVAWAANATTRAALAHLVERGKVRLRHGLYSLT